MLGRALLPEEVGYFAEVARCIEAISTISDAPLVSDYAPSASDLRDCSFKNPCLFPIPRLQIHCPASPEIL